MTFKELLMKVKFEDVWAELNKEYSPKDGAFKAYLKVFNQLRELTPEPNPDGFCLAVVRVEDALESGHFIYDVFAIRPEDKEHYAFEMGSWGEWLSLRVTERCVETYGAAAFVAHSLFELTFFGYDATEVEKRIEEEIAILKERDEEFKNGTATYIPAEDAFKELGYVDTRTEEEKEAENQQFKRIMAENEKTYEKLLS